MEKSKVYAEADATTLMEAGIWTRMTSFFLLRDRVF